MARTRTKQPTKLQSLDQLSAIGVARQSSGEDGSKSIDDQIAMMEAACAAKGYALLDVYVEQDVSGQKPLEKRPGLKRAVDDVESGRAQIVVTAYFDRFVRSTKTQAEVVERIEAANGRMLTLDMGEISFSTAASWTSAQMLGVMAESYARSVAERTAASKARNVAKGVPPFPQITPAYQRRADGTLEQHPINAPIVREACELRLRGTSYVKITQFLNENGIAITSSGCEGMLKSSLLYGELRFGDLVNERAIDDPIISRGFARRMHAKTATRGRYSKSEHLLARQGVLICGTCGARLTVLSSKSSANKSYSYYRCGNRASCTAPAGVAAAEAETLVRDAAIQLASKRVGRASAEQQLEAARVEMEEAQQAYERAIRILMRHADEGAARDELDELARQRDAATEQHAHLTARTTPDLIVRTVDDWDDLSLDHQRRVIRATIERAVVTPGRGEGRLKIVAR
jgi:DNA invertase Pin-like site-specific DNA recombinase